MSQIERLPLHEVVAGRVRDLIIEGRLAPGEEVSEPMLCELLGVSRTPIREAIRTLAGEGLIVLRPGRSTIVRQFTREEVRGMLEVAAGTAHAKVPGYRIAGKSGTARKIIDGAYSRNHYVASFVGLAPVSDPRIIVAVQIDEPSGEFYYGGRVAAPAFSAITGGALRTLGVEPDAPFDNLKMVNTAGGAQ